MHNTHFKSTTTAAKQALNGRIYNSQNNAKTPLTPNKPIYATIKMALRIRQTALNMLKSSYIFWAFPCGSGCCGLRYAWCCVALRTG
ncbi:MAG: hypothetical protein JNM36_18615 [Chitinophagales bacterium]|nr:hypothetical protein [Chitinophagales bacterium]